MPAGRELTMRQLRQMLRLPEGFNHFVSRTSRRVSGVSQSVKPRCV